MTRRPKFWRSDWRDPSLPPLTSPPPFIRDRDTTQQQRETGRQLTKHETMIDEELITIVAQFVDYMSTPRNAFGIWIAATGVIAGSYLVAPYFPT